MTKGTKCDFIAHPVAERNGVPQKDMLPSSESPAVYVIDVMAFIQRFQALGAKTFGNLVERYVAKIMDIKPKGVREIHFVGDRYDFSSEKSIKADERILR